MNVYLDAKWTRARLAAFVYAIRQAEAIKAKHFIFDGQKCNTVDARQTAEQLDGQLE